MRLYCFQSENNRYAPSKIVIKKGVHMSKYVSKKQVHIIYQGLLERELKILKLLNEAKFLTTDMIRRQFFTGFPTELAAKRASNRMIKKLELAGLIVKLPRRIGGYVKETYGGSAPSVWRLTEVGYKVLRQKHTGLPPSRKHRIEGKPLFLEHQLGISEVATKLRELAIRGKISQLTFDFEPKSWRYFRNAGEVVILKPDLYAWLMNGGFEESYFLEIDRGTESPGRIFAKCQIYVSYFNTGIEEKRSGITPYIVWLVPDEKRCAQILNLLREKMPEASILFQVVIENDLVPLIIGTESGEESNG